jgi:hypothetical protein
MDGWLVGWLVGWLDHKINTKQKGRNLEGLPILNLK